MPGLHRSLCTMSACALLTLAGASCAGEFTSPIRVVGIKDLIAGPGITPGDILEVRAGPGVDDQSFSAATVLRGPASTTALVAYVGRRGAPTATPAELQLDVIPQTVLSNVQVFSLAGGCRRGATAVFPFVQNLSNNFRPSVLQISNGIASVSPLAVAGTAQVHSIECASDPNGQDIYYLVSNASQARGELWKTTGANPPVLVYNNLPTLNSPFTGGIRPLVVYTSPGNIAGLTGLINIVYSRSDGAISLVSLEHSALNLALVCTLFTEAPPPTLFTTVRDGRLLAARGTGAINRIASVGDFDRNGGAELIATPTTSCAPVPIGKGSATGGNGYNWTSYGSIANPERGWSYVGNGNGLWRYEFAGGSTQTLTTPLIGPGGPYDFIGGRDADTRTFGFLALGARPDFPRQLRVQAMAEVQDTDRFSSSFEGPAFDRWYVYNQAAP